ncbi:hypothetical protein F1643_09270 [Azospirillum sp. INR13]|uniref:hypothetical protein n=1 Tax=Azospirillum sp. INR13 TaxID=2596919 RepID=UPI00189209C6|nr:hypothetical protein [Azospirillum sp. INR13]MBF5094633.1 hypothetical protein [Azospirillum sp. INR13]
MDSYRKNYEPLPDTDGLDGVRMGNGSEVLDYDAAVRHLAASSAFLAERSKRMAARIAQGSATE